MYGGGGDRDMLGVGEGMACEALMRRSSNGDAGHC
jgi:hypothetical protein